MTKKRFIAGAVCPACKKQDTLRWWQEQGVERVECVQCGHTDRRAPESVAKSEHIGEHDSQDIIGVFKPE